jgi:hypothetical protein
VSLIGSYEVNEHESLQINDSIIVGKLGDDSEQTEFGSSTNENRPVFSIIFRNRNIARNYKATIKKFLKELIAQHYCEYEADISDLEFNVWEEENEDSEDHHNDKKNPGGGEIFRTRPDRPQGPPSLLYNG